MHPCPSSTSVTQVPASAPTGTAQLAARTHGTLDEQSSPGRLSDKQRLPELVMPQKALATHPAESAQSSPIAAFFRGAAQTPEQQAFAGQVSTEQEPLTHSADNEQLAPSRTRPVVSREQEGVARPPRVQGAVWSSRRQSAAACCDVAAT